MDYFQGVVTEYLRANRATFVNTEFLIQLDEGDMPAKGRHWYCDVVAVNFAEKTIYLCEVTFSNSLQALMTRLQAWATNWSEVRKALARDCSLGELLDPPSNERWKVKPWVFVPKKLETLLNAKFALLKNIGDAEGNMPRPDVMWLEHVVPWEYRHWGRKLAALDTKRAEDASQEG